MQDLGQARRALVDARNIVCKMAQYINEGRTEEVFDEHSDPIAIALNCCVDAPAYQSSITDTGCEVATTTEQCGQQKFHGSSPETLRRQSGRSAIVCLAPARGGEQRGLGAKSDVRASERGGCIVLDSFMCCHALCIALCCGLLGERGA